MCKVLKGVFMVRNIFIASSLVVLFTGCASFTYSIKPEFDEKNKILTIDTLKFENAKLTQDLNPINSQYVSKFQEKVQAYSVQNSECKKIHYYGMFAGNRAYINSDFEEDIKNVYSGNVNDNCIVTEILNLKFFACRGQYRNDYLISIAIRNSYGFSSVERLQLEPECFNKFMSHFKDKAIQNKVDIKERFIKQP